MDLTPANGQALRLTLPRDQWAEIRPRLKVRGRDLIQRYGLEMATVMPRMMHLQESVSALQEIVNTGSEAEAGPQIIAAMEGVTLSGEDIAAMQRFQHAAIVAFVGSWSYPFEVSMDTVPDLDEDAYDLLQAECGPRAMAVTQADAGFGPDAGKDPGSFGPPSADTGNGAEGNSSTSDPETGSSPSTPVSPGSVN